MASRYSAYGSNLQKIMEKGSTSKNAFGAAQVLKKTAPQIPQGKSMPGMDSVKYYKSSKKMTPAKIAQRKRTTISNAASKVMGGLYSK